MATVKQAQNIEQHNPTPEELDERVAIPLDAETALRAMLATTATDTDDAEEESS